MKPNLNNPAPDPVPAEYLNSIMDNYGVSVKEVSAILRVHELSPYRWMRGDRQMDWAYAELLRIKVLDAQ